MKKKDEDGFSLRFSFHRIYMYEPEPSVTCILKQNISKNRAFSSQNLLPCYPPLAIEQISYKKFKLSIGIDLIMLVECRKKSQK